MSILLPSYHFIFYQMVKKIYLFNSNYFLITIDCKNYQDLFYFQKFYFLFKSQMYPFQLNILYIVLICYHN